MWASPAREDPFAGSKHDHINTKGIVYIRLVRTCKRGRQIRADFSPAEGVQTPKGDPLAQFVTFPWRLPPCGEGRGGGHVRLRVSLHR